VELVCQVLSVSERRACSVLGQSRATQRHMSHIPSDEEQLRTRIVELATSYGRYGYRRITAMLRQENWQVNHKRVERIWRQEGLKVPKKQPKRRRLWLNDGSCVRLRPQHKDHVWSYDFMVDRTADGRAFRILAILDEYTRECLAILVAREQESRRMRTLTLESDTLEMLGDHTLIISAITTTMQVAVDYLALRV